MLGPPSAAPNLLVLLEPKLVIVGSQYDLHIVSVINCLYMCHFHCNSVEENANMRSVVSDAAPGA